MIKRGVIFIVLLIAGRFSYVIFFETWIWRTFPSTCPLAKYLPDKAKATKCIYTGGLDFRYDFEATGDEAAFREFARNLAADHNEELSFVEKQRGKTWILSYVNPLERIVVIRWMDGNFSVSYVDL